MEMLSSVVVRVLDLQSMATGRATGHNNFAPIYIDIYIYIVPIYYALPLIGGALSNAFA